MAEKQTEKESRGFQRLNQNTLALPDKTRRACDVVPRGPVFFKRTMRRRHIQEPVVQSQIQSG